jgi:hypothetical protein
MGTFSGTQFERILTNEGNSVVMQHNALADVAQRFWSCSDNVVFLLFISLFQQYFIYIVSFGISRQMC